MLCGGDREKGDVAMEEKWDYVNLDDFKSESCWTPFSYFFIWLSLFISIAVYGVDTFTAVNLLAFSRWSGRVQPAIPFNISRWIFAACIIASFILLAYRWIHAIRSIRSGSITRSFLDPLAVRIQSIRLGKRGRGYRRFLVFAELTKDRKAAEYVALYAYFSFQFWMNTIFADGPRQVLNAITLYSVMQMDLIPGGKNAAHDDGTSSVGQFFNNVKILAEDNNLQAVVLFGMLFTLVVWVLSVLKLISAIVLYLIFLFHHIPAEDGSLSKYCRRKVGQRLKRIVHRKNTKALAKGLKLQNRAPTQPMLAMDSNPTLPSLAEDKHPTVASSLSRSTTQTTLPPYSRSASIAPTANPTLPNLELDAKPTLTRTGTSSSAMSESASLTSNAAGMGYSPLDGRRPTLPPVPPLPSNVPSRMATPHSRGTPAPYENDGCNSPGPEYRNLTDSSDSRSYQSHTPAPDYASAEMDPSDYHDYFNRDDAPAHYDPYGPPRGTSREADGYGGRYGTPSDQRGAPRAQQDYYPQDPYSNRSYTPASTGGTPAPYRSYTPASTGGTPAPYRSYTPASTGGTPAPYRSNTPASHRPTPPPQAALAQPPPRTFTPVSSATPAPQNGGYAAFNPSMVHQTSQPRSNGPPGPGSFTRANTASPSAMHRAPPGHTFTRSNTHQY
ncbi:hypothetical protein CBS147339_6995 [Penicillium roqueforti]|uniref:Genomic scaffold, ProqFM164S04 n=1 Tax=Penicillium roqueforti (strain FM164) TaxID=1365484 RepID=W6QFF8_PENRF|nr:hypothetical protein CBS147339_6995 [Penicillium roqueforti]KAI3102486.1 hypothetical protein CBS147338_2580 [Penicillium roqueforti]KAI3138651.1 hypothetical protein CBS147325_7024 [Penicillium roqueforti]KAI3182296.1 hypothetical protein DTO032C6_7360 [Penicillium roqueforti]CDM35230.1 unnamed protein product [Penicillium roqueforti FM164]